MIIGLTILSLIFLLGSAYIVAMNWGCVIANVRNKRRGDDRRHSTIPFVSLFPAALAMLAYPLPHKAWLLAVPLLDIGSWLLVLGLLWLPVVMVRGLKDRRSVGPGATDRNP
jgi:hypothetical protein